MKAVGGLLIALLVLALTPVDGQNRRIDRSDVENVLNRTVPLLSQHARDGGSHHFAAVLLLDDDPRSFTFTPPDTGGTGLIVNRQLGRSGLNVMPEAPVNYLVARPNKKKKLHQHAEGYLIEKLNNLWNCYKDHHNGREPTAVVIFSRLYPCFTGYGSSTGYCLNNIENILEEPPYNTTRRFLVYGSGANNNPNYPINHTRITNNRDIRGMWTFSWKVIF